ncbi:proline-rich protein 36-like [Varroa jacobsoni]|uniref:proline-rich protein 36-like n=1 Tax=Varroa jacobsoni TaxID=62625 RepID=UPI000BFA1A3C|nr:proline-rich protein 36-like [Varroa jacobsoni]
MSPPAPAKAPSFAAAPPSNKNPVSTSPLPTQPEKESSAHAKLSDVPTDGSVIPRAVLSGPKPAVAPETPSPESANEQQAAAGLKAVVSPAVCLARTVELLATPVQTSAHSLAVFSNTTVNSNAVSASPRPLMTEHTHPPLVVTLTATQSVSASPTPSEIPACILSAFDRAQILSQRSSPQSERSSLASLEEASVPSGILSPNLTVSLKAPDQVSPAKKSAEPVQSAEVHISVPLGSGQVTQERGKIPVAPPVQSEAFEGSSPNSARTLPSPGTPSPILDPAALLMADPAALTSVPLKEGFISLKDLTTPENVPPALEKLVAVPEKVVSVSKGVKPAYTTTAPVSKIRPASLAKGFVPPPSVSGETVSAPAQSSHNAKSPEPVSVKDLLVSSKPVSAPPIPPGGLAQAKLPQVPVPAQSNSTSSASNLKGPSDTPKLPSDIDLSLLDSSTSKKMPLPLFTPLGVLGSENLSLEPASDPVKAKAALPQIQRRLKFVQPDVAEADSDKNEPPDPVVPSPKLRVRKGRGRPGDGKARNLHTKARDVQTKNRIAQKQARFFQNKAKGLRTKGRPVQTKARLRQVRTRALQTKGRGLQGKAREVPLKAHPSPSPQKAQPSSSDDASEATEAPDVTPEITPSPVVSPPVSPEIPPTALQECQKDMANVSAQSPPEFSKTLPAIPEASQISKATEIRSPELSQLRSTSETSEIPQAALGAFSNVNRAPSAALKVPQNISQGPVEGSPAKVPPEDPRLSPVPVSGSASRASEENPESKSGSSV